MRAIEKIRNPLVCVCLCVCLGERKEKKEDVHSTGALFFFCCCCYFPEVSSTKVFLLNLVDVGCFFFSLLFFSIFSG